MSRKNNYISQYEDFFKVLKLCLKEFSNKYNVSCNSYFAEKLGFKSANKEVQFNQLLNVNDKDLTVRELLLLCEVLQEDSKPILDFIAQKTNFIVSKIAYPTFFEYENIEKALLKITSENGLLNSQYLEFVEDDNLTEDEIINLIKLSYKARSSLNSFEFLLKEKQFRKIKQ